ncbi:metalloregulator ArsR/SmtB family transcription factor [Desertimonas flava]|uniref:metalloregulator ArsR/SmtB family transcription factor n=1 Tax=Desertimonas flava TaxID=2064846 RepID=UPI0019690BDF|nr:metalloregulator ArsR/SmtB family transcription factor [Desertimonas flava]
MTSSPAALDGDDAVFRALAEPNRRAMLRLVRDRPLAVGEIAEHFSISQQAVSQHLRTLKDADLVVEQRAGTRRLYLVRPDGLRGVRQFVEELWPSGLARLKEVVEAEQRGSPSRGANA